MDIIRANGGSSHGSLSPTNSKIEAHHDAGCHGTFSASGIEQNKQEAHLERNNFGRGVQTHGPAHGVFSNSCSQNDSAYHTRSTASSQNPGEGSSNELDSEQFTKGYVQELSKENSSLRSRLKGVNILSTLLSEAREEISNLNTQKNKMEIAVENLQSRLHRLGADTSVDLAEHEIFMPGHDKQFLNSLISENMRLQKALKSGAKDSSAVVKDEQQTEVCLTLINTYNSPI